MALLQNKYIVFSMVLMLTVIVTCSKIEMDAPIKSCTVADMIHIDHPKASILQEKIEQMVHLGVPGIAIAIKDGNGIWASASGFSKIETRTPMEICHLQFGQSIAKTYMATAILLLYEQGLIDLDEKITKYLPASTIKDIANTDDATVRMLLNHTSGIPEYNDKPNYVTYILQHPLHTFTVNDYLDYTRGAAPKFSSGEKYSYTNTNYILLALIADQITGDHKAFIQQNILETQGLSNSYYLNEGFMELPHLVNTYWDRYSNGIIENCSDMHRTNVASLIGDDGIIATPVDYISFLEKLLTHQILTEHTMHENMLDFMPIAPNEPDGSGLGIFQDFHKGHPQWGHSGGGIGAACRLAYFVDSETYYFIGLNLGISIEPKIANSLEKKLDELYDILLQE